jgi:hypothetical protein
MTTDAPERDRLLSVGEAAQELGHGGHRRHPGEGGGEPGGSGTPHTGARLLVGTRGRPAS